MASRNGTNKSETLDGTDDADVFVALGGGDTLNGLAGVDTFSAGDGADTVFGGRLAVGLDGGIYKLRIGSAAGDGDGELHGDAGNDKLYGGDVLAGGIGNDELTGGADGDRFDFKTGTGRDTVLDFDAKGSDHDIVDLGGSRAIKNFNDLKANHLNVSNGDVVITAGSDRITLDDTRLSDLDRSDFDF